jgi:hypothetical protein
MYSAKRWFLIAVIFGALSFCLYPKESAEVEQSQEVKVVQPLVVESPQEEAPIGVYEGTVTITGAGIEEICYEGLLFITKDGEKIHITATDAIRSNFNELY